MIKEELMIGDWVKVPCLVDTVEGDNGCRQIKQLRDCDLDVIGFKELDYNEIIPIPLTPEILEKNGFELKPDGWLWSNEGLEDQNYIFIQFRKGCEGVRNCEINFIHRVQVTFKQLYFVHELQHALKLCGIPKNIEL